MTLTPHYRDDNVTLYAGDCLDVLAELPDASVDSVVTDPPYGLDFMGKKWDTGAVAFDTAIWGHCLRVLKPGGHVLAFGGTRTWHRLACAIEDAGFEIRDSIFWIFGSGFPKSLNVSKDDRFCQCEQEESNHGSTRNDSVEQVATVDVSGLFDGLSPASVQKARGSSSGLLAPVQGDQGSGQTSHDCGIGSVGLVGGIQRSTTTEVPGRDESGLEGRRDAEASEGELQGRPVCAMPAGVPGDGTQRRLRDGTPSSDGAVDRSAFASDGGGQSHRPQPVEQCAGELGAVPVERGSQAGRSWPICGRCGKPQIPSGLGTALKPAAEPVVVGRKPLGAGTVAGNVLAHGVGALNIDATRIHAVDAPAGRRRHGGGIPGNASSFELPDVRPESPAGRWPANVVVDEVAAQEIDRQSGVTKTPATVTRGGQRTGNSGLGQLGRQDDVPCYGDEGGASRFFPTFKYQAKASTDERPTADGIAHPTVKPLDLMRWLVRLVTPPGGLVLEPFAGSGTTAEACIHEHMQCIAIEREADYLNLIVARLTKPMEIGFDFGEDA